MMQATNPAAGSAPSFGQPGEGAERRRYFRVQDEVTLKYRVLTPSAAEALVESLRHAGPSSQSLAGQFDATTREMEYLLRKITESLPEVASYMSALNRKVDLLAQALLLEHSELIEAPSRTVDLSAAGVAFSVPTPIAPGTPLEVKLLVVQSLLHVLALGKVVRCDATGNEAIPYRLAVDFEQIREEERELLCQHAVQKQATLLRRRRAHD